MNYTPPAIEPVPVVVTRHELMLDSIGNALFILVEAARAVPWWVLLLFAVAFLFNAGRVLSWLLRKVGPSVVREVW